MDKRIPAAKIKKLHEHFVTGGNCSFRKLAKELKISRNTIRPYLLDFNSFTSQSSTIENNPANYIEFVRKKPISERRLLLLSFFDKAIQNIREKSSNMKSEWIVYRAEQPDGYGYTQFAHYFSIWLNENKLTLPKGTWKIKEIPKSDYEILKRWRRSNDKKKWERAVVVLDSSKGSSILKVAKKVERSKRKVKSWLKLYERQGLDGLKKKERKKNEEVTRSIQLKKKNLVKILHEPPKNHGINRSSWSLQTLKLAYEKEYSSSISCTSISEYIKSQGYSFLKAKKVLTSTDPLFRQKLNRIKDILQNLKEDEKFFSVDEFGPFAIKMQGGRTYVKKGQLNTVPQMQKSKGSLICTAALELSTNQITHFYSDSKNTDEMIKLLDVLLQKYSTAKTIYFSWDAASWHSSKKLQKRINLANEMACRKENRMPKVELAPLPSSAQFLNVIESVFSGLARSITHNSNFKNVEECKEAIDLYFQKRNEDFKKNPKKAGKKIWGKEKVKPVFDETNNCKDKSWR